MSSPGPDGRNRYLRSCGAALLLLCTLTAGPTRALPDDQDQPIHITADKAVRDEKQGFTVYSGNVQMNQGSMEIKADELTIYHVGEEVNKIVAEGEPAKLWQQPELDKGVVHARALLIEYFRNEERVHLETNAHVDQDGSIVTGDSIDYFITEQLIKADSDETQEGNRVQVVIPPSAQQETSTPGAGGQSVEVAAEAKAQPAAPTPADSAPAGTGTAPGNAQPEGDVSGPTDSE